MAKAIAKKAETQAIATIGNVTPGHIKMVIQKVQKWGSIYAYFHPTVTGWINAEKLPLITVSRLKPGGCNFRIDLLHAHDNHAPPFKTEELCDLYIARVMADIVNSDLGGVTVEFEIQLVEKPINAEYNVVEG
jgi:hypothetical protein